MIKGEDADFAAFYRSEMDKYESEVREKWGNTEAYKISREMMKNKSQNEKNIIAEKLMKQFAKFGKIKELPPDSPKAQAAVKELQDYITENFYPCSKEILAGLGEIYIADERFRENIANSVAKGTAEFVSSAIKIYCK